MYTCVDSTGVWKSSWFDCRMYEPGRVRYLTVWYYSLHRIIKHEQHEPHNNIKQQQQKNINKKQKNKKQTNCVTSFSTDVSVVPRAVPRGLKQERQWKTDLTAENNAFLFIDFYIIETLYIPVTITTNSDHAVEKLLW
jgi:hypothetical protein